MKKYSVKAGGIRSAAIVIGALTPMAAFAELTNDAMVGPGLRSRPAYDGSADQRTELVPVVRYLGEPWFVRSTQGVLEGGLRAELIPGLHAGVQLAYEPGRRTSESGFLQGHDMPSVKAGASVGVQAEWDHQFGPMPVTLLGRIRQNTDADLGAQIDLRFSAGVFHSGPFGAGVFTQATWANAKAASARYGVSAAQAVEPDLPAFHAGSGWLFASFGLLWSFELSPNWVVVGNLEERRLQGAAARSPLAERASNLYASAGLAYRF